MFLGKDSAKHSKSSVSRNVVTPRLIDNGKMLSILFIYVEVGSKVGGILRPNQY